MKKLLWIIIIVVAVSLVKIYFGETYRMPSGSMKPTLLIGEHFFSDSGYYENNVPERNEVAVFIFPEDRTKKFVKRIIALPGDEIQIKDNAVYVNGSILDEPFAQFTQGVVPAIAKNFGPYTIPSNSAFVLGDNRNHSYDSRYWGPVPIKDLVGKATRIYWSSEWPRVWSTIR